MKPRDPVVIFVGAAMAMALFAGALGAILASVLGSGLGYG